MSLVIIYTSHLLSKDKWPRYRVDELLEELDPRRKAILYRIINLIAPIMAAMLIVIAWPAAIYIKLSDLRKAKIMAIEESLREEKQKFKVQHSDLVERLTLTNIEKREIVADPLGAVPKLPFGHLNASWQNFIRLASANDAIWSFSSEWTAKWGKKQFLSGYVIVYEYGIGPYFLTSSESDDD